MNEDTCIVDNWESMGESDALNGLDKSRFDAHRKACEAQDIAPNKALYENGYQRGLVAYCSAENGLSVGRNGYAYLKTCPQGGEASFLQGYKRGRALHDIELEIAKVRHRLNSGDISSSKPGKGNPNTDPTGLDQQLVLLEEKREQMLWDAEQYLLRVSPDL